MCNVQVWFLFSGLIAFSSAVHHHETTIEHTTVEHDKHHHHHHTAKPPTTTTHRSIFQTSICNNVSKKRHAIQLLEEWVKHNYYNAVERLYHDIYHKALPDRKRFLLDRNGTFFGQHYFGSHSFHQPVHSYTSLYDEAFLNEIPDYNHVESYIHTHMNAACRREIMNWIEDLAEHHTNSPPTSATMAETGEHCTHDRDAHHVISLLYEWERNSHFSDVQRLYLEVALGFHAFTDTNMDGDRAHGELSVSDYEHIQHNLLKLSSNCRKIVFAWIEDDARKHTIPA